MFTDVAHIKDRVFYTPEFYAVLKWSEILIVVIIWKYYAKLNRSDRCCMSLFNKMFRETKFMNSNKAMTVEG